MAQQAILEPELSSIFCEKCPLHLSKSIRNSLVRYGPYALLGLLSLNCLLLLLNGDLSYFRTYTLHLKEATSLAVLICSLLTAFSALPGLIERRRQGWAFLYRAGLLYILSCLISLDLAGLLLMVTLGFYLLFEIRPAYR